MVYLDYAATSLKKPTCVMQAVTDAMAHLGNSGRGAHQGSLDASRAIYQARETIAEFFGCSRPDHVVFTSNSTEALNLSIFGLFQMGDHVITTCMEHNSVLRPLYELMNRGVWVDFLPVDAQGNLCFSGLEQLIRPNTKGIVVTHASNLTGTVNPIRQISEIAHRHQIYLVVDGSQTAGAIPVNMKEMGIDVFAFTGHKSLMGPQGTGGLCIEGDIPIRPFKMGGTGVQSYLKKQPEELPSRLEAGTLNGHGIAGLLAAVEYIREQGPERIFAHESAMAGRFYEGIREIPGVTAYGDFSKRERAPIVTINCGNAGSSEIADILSEDYDIAVRPGAHCAPLMHESLGTREQGAVRFSFGWFTTVEEVDVAVQAVKEIMQKL